MRVGKRKERCHFLPFFGNLRKNYSFFSYFFFFFPFLFFISPLFRLWPQETKSRRGKGGSFSGEGEETRRTLGGEGSVTFEIITPFRATAPEESRFTSDHSARTLGFFSLHSTLWLIHRHHFHSSLRQFAIFFFPLLIPRIMLCHAYSREWKIRTSLSIYINCNFFFTDPRYERLIATWILFERFWFRYENKSSSRSLFQCCERSWTSIIAQPRRIQIVTSERAARK